MKFGRSSTSSANAVEGYVDPEIDNAVYKAKYLRASAILKERSNDLQPGTSTSGASGSNGLHSISNQTVLGQLHRVAILSRHKKAQFITNNT